jgi:hypothetical protein|nr:MAG TPA: hypothetical protein [Bacteriophage sp.]
MEQELIIAEILRNKPQGIKLYSPIFGNCTFCCVKDESNDICVRRPYNEISYFNFDGVYHTGGECLLFPSKEMRDWSKFAWKKGDILVNKDNAHIIFEKFSNDTYTTFIGKHYFDGDNESGYSYIYGRYTACTQQFHIEEGDAVQTYISNIEKEIGGKLDFKTLEVKKEQPEFKDGDIAFADYGNRQDVFIVSDKTGLSEGYSSFISLDLSSLTLSMGYRTCFFKKDLCKLRLATDSEKKQLFSALEKEGKRWDSEKKQIVDLKLKWTPKPFDKVVVRCDKADKWSIDFFSYKVSNGYICTGDVWFGYCLPYNEETAHLLGTTDDWEGGEQ